MNKNITHIGGMIRAVNKRLKLGLDNVFAGTRIEGGKDGKRSPFPVEFIRNTILAESALAELNDAARDVVLVVMETGARPSEIVNLSKQRIVLDAQIPLSLSETQSGRCVRPNRAMLLSHERNLQSGLVGGWKTFLRNHADGIVAMDLFVVPTISSRCSMVC